MKLSIERKAMLSALSIVKSACGRTDLAVLSNVLINTFDKSVEFICTDLDLVLRAKVDAEIKSKGSTTVPANLLHDLVRGFADESVELDLTKNTLHVVCGKSKYKLGIVPVEEFPPSPRLRDAFEIEVSQSTLRSLLASTSFASSTDPKRPLLNGTLLRINGNLSTVSCDGRRLALLSAECSRLGKKPRDLILPRAAVTALVRLLTADDEDETVRIVTAENLCQFHLGDTVLTTRLIEGQYPDIQGAIPATKGKGIPIGRADLLNALQRCALISDTCQLEFRKQSLNIRAINNRQVVGEALESLLIPPADNLRIAFNTRYLTETLGAIADDEVQFFGHSADEPVVLKVEGKPWLAVVVSHNGQTETEAEPAAEPEVPANPPAE